MENGTTLTLQIAFLTIQLGVILAAAKICGKFAERLRLPSVLGELGAGILLGPYLLGSLTLPGFAHGIFPLNPGAAVPVSATLYSIAVLGSIVLLFMSGLQTDLKTFLRYSIAGTAVGAGGLILPFLFGAGVGVWFFGLETTDPKTLFLGVLSTATSVGVSARILAGRRAIDTPEGTTVLAAAVIDDVLGIIVLAVVTGIAGISGSGAFDWEKVVWIVVKGVGVWLGATAAGLLLARKLGRFLRHFPPPVEFSMLALGMALLVSGFFERAGVAMIIGAYVMGLSLAKTDLVYGIQRSLAGIYAFLTPVFFVVMGMLVDVRVLGDIQVLGLGLLYAVTAVAAKLIGCGLPALGLGFNTRGALRIGAGMVPRGEVTLIMAAVGIATLTRRGEIIGPVIDSRTFGVVVLMMLITILAAPPLLEFALNLPGSGLRGKNGGEEGPYRVFEFPGELVRDCVLALLVERLERAGFTHSDINKDGALIHFRRETQEFTLSISGLKMEFACPPGAPQTAQNALYETLSDLHRHIGELREVAAAPTRQKWEQRQRT